MDKLSINSIFQGSNKPIQLNINSLFTNNKVKKSKNEKPLDIDSLFNVENRKERSKEVVFNKIINKCYIFINRVSKSNISYCYYTVPEFMFGSPLYDITECVDYIIENIDSRLDIIKIQDNIIYISWSKYHPKLK